MKNLGIKIILVSLFVLTAGCSPFGNSSFIDGVAKSIGAIFDMKTDPDVVPGGSGYVETNPVTPAENYKVNYSVGHTFNQTAFTTNDGYKVYTNVQGNDVH